MILTRILYDDGGEQLNEKVILTKILKGKTKYFEQIIIKYNKRLYGYISKLTNHSSDTEDILQETFIKVYNKLYTYDMEKDFSVWLLSIARNTALDYMRKNKNHLTLVDDLDLKDMRSEHLPEQSLVEKEKSIVLDDLVNRLPEKYRVLIVLKYFEELSYDEISTRLKIDKNKIRWQLHQARKLLVLYNEEEANLWIAK